MLARTTVAALRSARHAPSLNAVRTAVRAPSALRSMSLAAVPYEESDPDFVTYPREGPGLNYDLNWSLADDDVTPRGLAFRNARDTQLFMHTSGSVDKATKVVDSQVKDVDAPLFCTDEFEGFSVADIDEFEGRFTTLKESLMFQDQLFVEDGAVGSDRASEIRVRVISDNADYALFFRNMLVRVPLKDPQTIPRPLTVYIASNSGDGDYSVSDFDPDTGKGVVAVSGSPGFTAVRQQVEHVAGQMLQHGGYQSIGGGGARVDLARKDGMLFFPDDHYTATEGADKLVLLPGNAVANADGTSTITIGAAAQSGAFATHACIWNEDGVAQLWAGGQYPGATDAPRGSIRGSNSTVRSNSASVQRIGHPSTIEVAGAASAAEFAALLGLSEERASVLVARAEEHGTKFVSVAAAGGKKKAAGKKKATSKKAAAKK